VDRKEVESRLTRKIFVALGLLLVLGGGRIYWAWTVRKQTPVQKVAVPVEPPKPKTVIKPVVVEKPPEEVKIRLATEPKGAHVIIDGKDLGVTPYEGKYKRSTRVLHVTLRKKGYQDKTLAVNLGESAVINTTLKRVPRVRTVHKSLGQPPKSGTVKPKTKPKPKGPKKVGDLKNVF
jgi:hypothetical protein